MEWLGLRTSLGSAGLPQTTTIPSSEPIANITLKPTFSNPNPLIPTTYTLPPFLLSNHSVPLIPPHFYPHQPESAWLTYFTLTASLSGFLSGFYLSGRSRSYQFLAENAHRLPRTVGGWYVYHKYKHYEIAHVGGVGGVRAGILVGAVAGVFGVLQGGLEMGAGKMWPGKDPLESDGFVRGREGLLPTLGAGILSSLSFAAFNRLTFQYTKYALLFGTGSALAMGLLEEGFAAVYGTSVKYGTKRGDAGWVPGVWEGYDPNRS